MELSREEEIELAWAKYRGDRLPPPPMAETREEWLPSRLKEQDQRCAYCKRKVEVNHPDPEFRATIDHVVARSNGGLDTFENVVASCGPCNNLKANRSVDELMSDPNFRIRLYETEYKGL